ncbi:Alpha/Beta hydrolase protein [Hyaloraphidium curvatum]|nr:Alpha/Beta hydrolase protein [Hyaloraphidium curvatum]
MDEAHTALLVAAGILLVYFLLPEACPALHRFRPTPWLLSGHLQTYYASGFTYRDEDLVHYERDTIRMPDGGTVTQDWSPRIPATLEEAVKPVVFITHGLTGGSHESYVMSLVRYVVDDLDMFAVVQNFRGCAETELTSPICYNGGWTGDLALGIEHARRRILDVRRQHGSDESAIVMAGVGFSLGANIMAKFVGETGPACPLTCHISVANPADLLAGSRHLESSFFLKNVYSRIMGGNLITMLKRHIHHFHEAQYPFVDLPRVVASKSILEFDDRFTAPLFGFASAAEYYRYASSANFVHTISIPTVFVHALDDPVAPMSSLPILEITKNPYLSLVWTQHGGHLGFFRGLRPLCSRWSRRRNGGGKGGLPARRRWWGRL